MDNRDTVTGQNLAMERDRLTAAIDANTYRDQHVALYAARQALSWAINPESACPPCAMIMGTQEGLTGCPVERHPSLS